MTKHHLCVVISTLGERHELRRLLESLVAQTLHTVSVGIADQGDGRIVRDLELEFAGQLSLFVVRTGRTGLSAGRNDVMRAAPVGVTHFIFPNDTSIYPEGFLGRLHDSLGEADVAAVSYVDSEGPRHSLGPTRCAVLAKAEVFEIIEPGLVVRADRAMAIGGFDETIGTGARSRRQSGEGTDLLLRMMDSAPVKVAWLPDLTVEGVAQSYRLTPRRASSKARGYGYGYGYILESAEFPLSRKCRAVFGPLVRILQLRADPRTAWATALGRIEGMAAAWRAGDSAKRRRRH